MHARILLPFSILILAALACGTSSPADLATPTSLFASMPSPAASALTSVVSEPGTALPASTLASLSPTLAPEPQFTLAVIVDTATQHVTREQALYVVSEAGKFLNEFSPVGLLMTDYTEDGSGGDMGQVAARYVNEHAASLPNGLVIFSTAGQSSVQGGAAYGFTLEGPRGFKNAFVSPKGASNLLYVAVVDYAYRYMICGYGGSDTVKSAVALQGECRGQTGIACVQNNGYSMCSNAVRDLYMNTPTHLVSSMIVHGLLHNFGPNGDQDHYATAECNARMGYPAGFFDLQESEYYNGLCPYVYEDFTKAYRP